ncbi:hypothetical protein EMCRGX_G004965 [Ephydatia muelleri]|eukprot:Em0006g163a
MYVTNGLFLSGKGYKTIGIRIKNSTGIKPVPKVNSCTAVDTSDTAWRQEILGLSKGSWAETNLHLCSAVADFNSAVPPDKALQIHSLLSASLVSQKELSSTLDTCMFNLLLETSSNADQARLLSVSAPHASSWLSVLPSQGLGLHLDAPVHEVAIKWWLGQGSQCALCPGNALILWDIMPPLVSVAVMWWYDTTPFVMFWLKHATGPHLGIQVEAGNDPTADHSHTHPADLLLTNWTTGKTAAFDISVTSPLNTHTLMEAGVSAGSAALASEGRKHRANDAKCKELGWLCVPLVADTYGAWGNEAVDVFSQLASRLATLTCRPKSAVLRDIYGRLNLHLLRANATAILTRCILN